MKHQICLKIVWGCVKDDIRAVFCLFSTQQLHFECFCSFSFRSTSWANCFSYAWNDPINTQHSLAHIPSLPLAWPFVPSLLFSSSPIWSLFIQNPPVLSSFSLRSGLVDADVGCLLELSNRKFPESLGAQNWARNNRKVEREANPTRMIYDSPFYWMKIKKLSTFLHCSGYVASSMYICRMFSLVLWSSRWKWFIWSL